jgi:DNA-binding NtrC family response regulator
MPEQRVPDEKTAVQHGVTTATSTAVPRVTAISGPAAGRAFAMTRVLATIGRHATNDLVLEDKGVSGVHLELRRGDRGVHVRDAGSTNGTWLGAHRVTEIELAIGAELRVGETLLRFDVDPGAAAAGVSPQESFGSLVGESTAMREIFATLERVAPKHLSILFQGEGGTGKEEMARAVVAKSTRATAPFVVVDVTAIPEALLDAALFGQEKTATTDAAPGLLEAANGGTAFIDEVGDLPLQAQAKLVRLLERQELVRVGGHAPTKIDARVLAATSRDLRHDIEAGNFREDLYFRLAQVRILAPPLRDRAEDVPVLCKKLLSEIGQGASFTIEDEALRHLAVHPWPGNVRELRNALERAAALAQGNVIRRADVAGEGFGFRGTRDERSALDLSGTFRIAKDRAIERFESAYLSALMRRCNGNVSLASRESDIARHHLRDLLKKRALYGIAWDKIEEP